MHEIGDLALAVGQVADLQLADTDEFTVEAGRVHESCVAQLGDAAAGWGGEVPEDPGIAELADLFEAVVADVPARTGEPGNVARTSLAGAVEDLRAAARLGGLLPAVTLWHLHRAMEQERAAHQHLHPRAPTG
ncbi:hypothetical protein PUR49_06850 [Streptomyces sp. BE147]|uniref:hypothetical protein n=1 Tax=Streptomyces sp. BE147 TaxID=3002524 RepID=UPI002E790190|nr:hypothetical protein [Streptomyces sp. BE147]MEE1736223.1 hypothetical protein [Streptomyces sp. BE147]